MARRSRRFKRADADYVWCGLLTSNNSISAGEENLVITAGDWSATTGREEAVLERIRASFGYAIAPNTELSTANVQVAIYKTAINTPAFAAVWTVDELVEQDVLYFRQWQVVRSATGVAQPAPLNVEIDVKAKRRITTYDDIRVLVAVSASGIFGFASRALVRI